MFGPKRKGPVENARDLAESEKRNSARFLSKENPETQPGRSVNYQGSTNTEIIKDPAFEKGKRVLIGLAVTGFLFASCLGIGITGEEKTQTTPTSSPLPATSTRSIAPEATPTAKLVTLPEHPIYIVGTETPKP